MEGPAGAETELFLHVLEIADENDKKMSDVKLVEKDGQPLVEINAGGQKIIVLFAKEGPLGALVKLGNEPRESL